MVPFAASLTRLPWLSSRGTQTLRRFCLAFVGFVSVACASGGDPLGPTTNPNPGPVNTAPPVQTPAKPAPVNTIPGLSNCSGSSLRGDMTATQHDFLFLFYQGGTMLLPLSNGDTRWSAMRKSVNNFLQNLPTDGSVRWGANRFPLGDSSTDCCKIVSGAINCDACKDSSGDPNKAQVPVPTNRCASSTYQDLSSQSLGLPLAVFTADGKNALKTNKSSLAAFYYGNPISAALSGSFSALQAAQGTPTRRQVLVLVAGDTSQPYGGLPAKTCTTDDVGQSFNAIDAARKQGMLTFVVGITECYSDGTCSAASTRPDELSYYADAGGLRRTPNCSSATKCHYEADISEVNQSGWVGFDNALQQLRYNTTGCVFEIPAPATLGRVTADQLNLVFTDGQSQSSLLARDVGHSNGWDVIENGARVQIYGGACQQVIAGTAKVQFIIGCN